MGVDVNDLLEVRDKAGSVMSRLFLLTPVVASAEFAGLGVDADLDQKCHAGAGIFLKAANEVVH